ncbi:uncharacterized protein ACN427_010898 isoform 1-T1 [Glossina fuscipes fuscipes]
MATQRLPRFTKTHAATTTITHLPSTFINGRQTSRVQKQHSPIIYNDTVKRIEESSDFNILKRLVVDYLGRRWGGQRLNQNLHYYYDNKYKQRGLQNSNDTNEICQPRHLRRSLESVESQTAATFTRQYRNRETQASERLKSLRQSDGSRGIKTLTYYLHLANDYYERGFLSNIKYLEHVGVRNQLRRQREQEQQEQQEQQLQKEQQLTTVTASLPGANERRTITHSYSRLSNTLAAIQKSEPLEAVNKSAFCNNNRKQDISLKDNYAQCRHTIRVKINPILNGNLLNLRTTSRPLLRSKPSMNDYLNGNFASTTATHTNSQQFKHSFNDLLNSLQDFTLNESHQQHPVPLIILTDYTKEQFIGDASPTSQTINLNRQLYPLNQRNIDYNSNLSVPNLHNYHSESRPP